MQLRSGCCRQGGRIGVVGVYVGYTNHFNIGGFMEKGMSMAAGQVGRMHDPIADTNVTMWVTRMHAPNAQIQNVHCDLSRSLVMCRRQYDGCWRM